MTAHCFGEESLRDLAAAGTDCIEHATGLQPDTIDTFAAQGIAIVPTLVNIDTFPGIAGAAEGKFPTYAAHLRDLHARRYETVAAAHDAGVPIYLGTDAGGSLPHGLVAAEAAELVKAGLSVAEVLDAATWGARRWLGRPGTGRGRERRPGGLPGRPAQGHRRTRRAVARGAARPGCLLSRLPCARRGSGSGSARSPRTTSRRTAWPSSSPASGSRSGTRSTPTTSAGTWPPRGATTARSSSTPGPPRARTTWSARSTSPTWCAAASCPPRWATTPTTRTPGGASSPRGSGWSSAWSWPPSPAGWGCTGSRPACSRATRCRPGCCGRWASSARAARRGCCGCPTRAAPSAGATTTPTR